MAKKHIRAKNRRESGAYAPIPAAVLNSEKLMNLSFKASKLLLDLLAQVRFAGGGTVNNGDLCIAWSLMQKRGWRSKATLYKARDELLKAGFIILTRLGIRLIRNDKPNLYAITWWAIDYCDGKLDMKPTNAPLGTWKIPAT